MVCLLAINIIQLCSTELVHLLLALQFYHIITSQPDSITDYEDSECEICCRLNKTLAQFPHLTHYPALRAPPRNPKELLGPQTSLKHLPITLKKT